MRTLLLALLLGICTPALAQRAALDPPALERWLDAYGDAWKQRDAAAAGRLFTENATYYETPYAEPFRGRTRIQSYWSSVTQDQRDIEFEARIVAVERDVGVAQWSAKFMNAASGDRIELNGVFVLEFGSDGLCNELREWWVLRTPSVPAAN